MTEQIRPLDRRPEWYAVFAFYYAGHMGPRGARAPRVLSHTMTHDGETRQFPAQSSSETVVKMAIIEADLAQRALLFADTVAFGPPAPPPVAAAPKPTKMPKGFSAAAARAPKPKKKR